MIIKSKKIIEINDKNYDFFFSITFSFHEQLKFRSLHQIIMLELQHSRTSVSETIKLMRERSKERESSIHCFFITLF